MFGGINPGQMKAMMKQMGIKQEEVEVERVILEGADKRIVIEPASVQKITMQGQDSWQVNGSAREESREEGISAEDVALVVERTGTTKEKALEALREHGGNIAEAIVALSA